MTTSAASRSDRRRQARGGFVLIAVLWILVALAGLVGAYVAYALTMAQSADFYLRRVGAEAALSGALELAVYDLTQMDPSRRPEEGVLDYRIGDMRAQVHYASEALRLDLNKASLDSLTAFLSAEGGVRASAELYAQRILAWRQKANAQGAGMEDLSYRAAGVAYLPRHGPFQSVEELWDLRDIPPDVVARIAPLVTVYGGRAKWEDDPAKKTGAADQPPSAQPQSQPSPQAQPQGAPAGGQEGGGQDGAAGAQTPDGAQNADQALKPTRFRIRVIDSQGRVNAAEVVALAVRNGDAPYNVLLWRTGDDLTAPGDGRRR
ncbi:MAG TPA: type II secretion system protein GspK [Rhodoblastus sp.]|nr:type II secretion system protein GspK [Rhodoblastus sp.]